MDRGSQQSSPSHASQPNRRKPPEWMRLYLPSLLVFLLILIVWQVVQGNASGSRFVIPAPSTILEGLIVNRTLILRNAGATLFEAAGGFLVGNVLAILAAILFVYSATIEDMFYPLAVALRSIPLVAITPVIILIFGPDYQSKVVITSLIVFFPTLVNMVQGLLSVEAATLELMYTLNASELQVFWKVRLPFSMPYFFASLKIAPAAAILGAIIAEWIGSTSGLGYAIVQAMYDFNVARLWAIMVVATLLSVGAYIAVVLAEKAAIPWHGSVQIVGGEDLE